MTLKQWCKEKRISNVKGAEALGIDSSHFCNFKLGRSRGSQQLLAKVQEWTIDMVLPIDCERAYQEFHGNQNK